MNEYPHLRRLVEDDEAMKELLMFTNEVLDKSFPSVTPNDTDELIGQKYRGVVTGRDLVLEVFKKLADLKGPKPVKPKIDLAR